MYKFSKWILLIIFVLLLAIYLPHYYWMAFSKKANRNFVLYSSVKKEYLMLDFSEEKEIWKTVKGEILNRDDFEKLAPLFYFRQLKLNSSMPDSINGMPVSYEEIRKASYFTIMRSKNIEKPDIGLYPLFESKSGRVDLEMPDEFFRIKNKFQFISTSSNKIEEEKSFPFDKALRDNDFIFPAKFIFGNPTTRKAYDMGYLIIDSSDKLFHLKQEKGKPVVKEIKYNAKDPFIFINILENSRKELLAYGITRDSKVFLINSNSYQLNKIPIENYNYKKDNIRFNGTLLFTSIYVTDGNRQEITTIDNTFKVIGKYKEKFTTPAIEKTETFAQVIFPFTIYLDDSFASKYTIKGELPSFYSLIGIAISILLYIIFNLKFKKKKNAKYEILFIIFTGIYGFIALQLLKEE